MTNANRRPAFTLVEMLVASALIIFMMFIITTAFASGLAAFRSLKVQGDMQEKLRAVATTLRMDLTAPHFGGNLFPTNQGPYLNDHRLNDQTWQPPQQGYVRISQPVVVPLVPPTNPPTVQWLPEGLDPDGTALQYYRPPVATSQRPNPLCDLYLQFTVNLTDGHPATRDGRARRDQFFASDSAGLNAFSRPDYNVGDVPFSSYWAEVTYFLQPNGQAADGTVPLFTLYRRQKLLVEPNPSTPALVTQADPRPDPANSTYPPRTFPRFLSGETDRDFPDASSWYTAKPITSTNLAPFAFNSPSDVTAPVRRWGMSLAGWTTANPPPAYGQPQTNPSVFPQPFNTVLAEAGGNYADARLGQRIGGDVLLTDVVNFEIKVLWEPVRKGAPNTDKFFPDPTNTNPTPTVAVAPADSTEPQPVTSGIANPDYPFDLLPIGGNNQFAVTTQAGGPTTTPVRLFDTWTTNTDTSGAVQYIYGVDPTAQDPRENVPPAQRNQLITKASSPADPDYANWNAWHFKQSLSAPRVPLSSEWPTQANTNIPLRVRVRALQIKLRIWDKKSSQTRQVTIIQDL